MSPHRISATTPTRRGLLARGGTAAAALGAATAAALAAPALLLRPGPARATAAREVDVELVLAVDVSRSVDAEEQEAQFRGYANAFRSPDLARGIERGALGSIAVTLFTWSDWNIQEDLVPWTRIACAADAEGFARALDAAPRRTWLYTSISGAMDHAARAFGRGGFEGTRRVVDISGDGANNSGRPVEDARAAALAAGITINGLAVVDRSPPPALMAQRPLDDYYREEVIGGPGSFLMVAEGFESFSEAVRRKIVREIAAAPPTGAPPVERATALA